MNKLNKTIISALSALVLVLVVILISSDRVASVGGPSQMPAVEYWASTVSTSSRMVLTTSELRLIATSTSREWIRITPEATCTQGALVSLANDATATALNSIYVNASSSLLLSPTSIPYLGSVRALSNGGTCNVNVTGNQ